MAKVRKIKHCKSCSKELDKSAKICPSCGKDQRNFFRKHKILTTILVIIVCGFIGILTSEAEEDKAAEIKVTAEQLAIAYNENEANAENIYGDKRVKITGKIHSISEYILIIDIDDKTEDKTGYSGVFCGFTRSEEVEKLSSLKKGQEITITGTCKGRDIVALNVDLDNCVINE